MNRWYQRSELWTTVFGAIALVLADGFGLELEAQTILAVSGTLIGYALSRGYVKGKEQEGTFTTV